MASAVWVRVIAKYNAGAFDEGERERGGCIDGHTML